MVFHLGYIERAMGFICRLGFADRFDLQNVRSADVQPIAVGLLEIKVYYGAHVILPITEENRRLVLAVPDYFAALHLHDDFLSFKTSEGRLGRVGWF